MMDGRRTRRWVETSPRINRSAKGDHPTNGLRVASPAEPVSCVRTGWISFIELPGKVAHSEHDDIPLYYPENKILSLGSRYYGNCGGLVECVVSARLTQPGTPLGSVYSAPLADVMQCRHYVTGFPTSKFPATLVLRLEGPGIFPVWIKPSRTSITDRPECG